MTTIAQLIRQLFGLFRWWVIIMPWEQSVRVRFGRWVRVLDAGPHLRIPYADAVFTQSVRQRMMHLNTQTVATKDGKTVTLGAAVAYSISDVRKLYETLHDAVGTVSNLCQCAIAEVVLAHDAVDCNPGMIGARATEKVGFAQFGLTGASFAFVRTFRLIQDQRYSYGCGSLDTTGQAMPGTPAVSG